jgi:hypothetical protein
MDPRLLEAYLHFGIEVADLRSNPSRETGDRVKYAWQNLQTTRANVFGHNDTSLQEVSAMNKEIKDRRSAVEAPSALTTIEAELRVAEDLLVEANEEATVARNAAHVAQDLYSSACAKEAAAEEYFVMLTMKRVRMRRELGLM